MAEIDEVIDARRLAGRVRHPGEQRWGGRAINGPCITYADDARIEAMIHATRNIASSIAPGASKPIARSSGMPGHGWAQTPCR